MKLLDNIVLASLFTVLAIGCADSVKSSGQKTDIEQSSDLGGDSAAPEDAGILPDSLADSGALLPDSNEPEPDTEEPVPDVGAPDVEEPPKEDKPTWWECRQAGFNQALTDQLKSVCNELHSNNPEQRKYGIRWVVLDDQMDVDAWVAERLSALNKYFEPAGFTFVTSSTMAVQNSTITDPGPDDKLSWDSLSSDLAQHLGSESTDTAKLVEELKAALSEVGVATNAINGLSVDKDLTAKAFIGTIARMRPTEIHVILTPMLNGTKGGGLSSGPSANPTGPRSSVVYMRTANEVASMVIAHEMGHFFGLIHPHMQETEETVEALATIDTAIHPKGHTAQEIILALGNSLGEDLDDAFDLKYPHWNSKSSVFKEFDQYRIGINEFWLGQDYFYRNLDGVPTGYDQLTKFVIDMQAGSPIFFKNFIAPGQGNNCSWNGESKDFSCEIGDPAMTFSASHPLVNDAILLDDGKRVNIMSYIAKTMGKQADPGNQVRFTEKSLEVMKLHANTPTRLLLRNHAL